MYSLSEISTRSKENVKSAGEVFTPFHIVDKMLDLFPENIWNDPEYCFLEPTCGNGQFIVKVFMKRLEHGLTIEQSLNTIIGMDISKTNILECHARLYEIIAYLLENKLGYVKKSEEFNLFAIRYSSIVVNNIFLVKDSLKVMGDYSKNKGILSNKSFVFDDPTGDNKTMSSWKLEEHNDTVARRYCKALATRDTKSPLRFFYQ